MRFFQLEAEPNVTTGWSESSREEGLVIINQEGQILLQQWKDVVYLEKKDIKTIIKILKKYALD